MKTKLIAGALAASLVIAGAAQAREQARMTADQVRSATLSSQSSVPLGSSRADLVVLGMLVIVAILAIVSTASAGGGNHYAMMASDKALKTDIKRVGTSPQGFGIYEFR